jgi:hypothetical protein
METQQEYYKWFDNLPKVKKSRFEYIINILNEGLAKWETSLSFQSSVRKELSSKYFRDPQSFLQDELYNLGKRLTEIQLHDCWGYIYVELVKIHKEIKGEQEFYNGLGWDLLWQLHFMNLITSMGLLDKYLSTDINIDSDPHSFDTKQLPEFDEIIKLLALTQEADFTFYQIESGHFTKRPEKHAPTFNELFRDEDNARKVKEIFEKNGYTINGKWQGLTSKKGELLSAYYVLKPILKPCHNTPTARIFYNEFGLPLEYISDDMLRKEPFNASRNEFETIFSSLLH